MVKGEKKGIKIKVPNVDKWMVTTLILAILLPVSLLLNKPSKQTGMATLTSEKIGEKVIEFINRNLVQQGSEATLVSVEEVSGLYRIKTTYRGQEIPVYATMDGKYLILPQGIIDMTQQAEEEEKEEQPVKASCENLPKQDNPELVAFVVSYCPFGLQMQRVFVEVVKNIPELAENLKIRYLGQVSDNKVLSMHGEREATENLRQICIREEQSDKFWDYIACFIKKGETENCLNEVGVDKDKLNACMNDVNRGVKYASEDFALESQYGVRGSPTLILNDQRVSEYDFGGRSAEAIKTIVCCGFNEQPEFCTKELTTQQAARSFSETYSGSSGSSGGQC